MNKQSGTFAVSSKEKRNITSLDIIEVNNVNDLPNTEPTLYKKGEYFTPTATSAPMVSSLKAQFRKDKWQKDSSGLALFTHQAKGRSSNIIEHFISNPGDIPLLPWEEALQIIDKFGTNAAKLHLILAAHTMRQENPWESKFTLSADDLINELGWDRRTDIKKSLKLKEVAKLAFVLGCLTIKATWVEGQGKKKISCSVQTSRIWETYIEPIWDL